jgi:uncharacterized membrane protein YfcA
VTFPISGVEVNPLIPPLVALLVATLTAPAGVSGAFLLLPFQVSVLGFTSPAVSATNLIYNIVAIPGGLSRYVRERRMAWPLTWVVILGTAPGVFVGGMLRVRYFLDPRTFKLFVGVVLLYLGVRLLYETTARSRRGKAAMRSLEAKFQDHVRATRDGRRQRLAAGLPDDAVVRTVSWSLRRIEYTFWGETFSFPTLGILALSLGVGLVGGIYGIGGGAIIAPFLVSVLGLPIYTVAGAALAGTLLTSIVGVGFFYGLSLTAVGAQVAVRPDWLLGLLFGVGGFAGTYLGARLQRFLPERLIRGVLGVLVSFLAVTYVAQYFR